MAHEQQRSLEKLEKKWKANTGKDKYFIHIEHGHGTQKSE